MDARALRWLVDAGAEADATGWEVDDAGKLEELRARLREKGVAFEELTGEEVRARRVAEGIAFRDPEGNRHEAFHSAGVAGEPFVPGRPISGFRTGDMGLGHAVLHVRSFAAMRPFVEDVLGFSLTDYAETPFRARFYHLNARHHSLAMIETGRTGLHHVMLEYLNLDDVGQGYDAAMRPQGENMVGTTLGRHTNDYMTSFYAKSPSGFLVELGWGGRTIDAAEWKATEMKYGPSFWGHDRNWLPPDKFREAQEIRAAAAGAGLRMPVQVEGSNFAVGPGPAPWWEV
ncbi:biphenyl-2,3-diol 1,2-dioxygenase [Hyaloraphidium curvatum]|nr:biphenyl-2,3-diol 1,2-dioxygenase [Hyaloraphidium curvatum]